MAKTAPKKASLPPVGAPSESTRTVHVRVHSETREHYESFFEISSEFNYLSGDKDVGKRDPLRPVPKPDTPDDKLPWFSKDKKGTGEDLFTVLSALGYGLPPAHTRKMLDWAYDRNQQIGLRKQPEEQIARLVDFPANPDSTSKTLSWQIISKAVIDLLPFWEEARTLAETKNSENAEPHAKLQLSKETGEKDEVIPLEHDPVKIVASLTETFETLALGLRAMAPALAQDDKWDTWKDIWATRLENKNIPAFERFLKEPPVQEDPSIATSKAPLAAGCAGLHGAWVVLKVAGSRRHKTVQTPIGFAGADKTVIAFDRPKDEIIKGAMSEGYHSFRVFSDPNSTDENDFVKQWNRIKLEAERDHLILNAKFCASKDPAAQGQNKGNDAAKQDGQNRWLAKLVIKESQIIKQEGNLLCGALLVTAPVKGITDIHIFEDNASLKRQRRALLEAQTKHRRRNLIALTAVTFIAGQLYAAPGADIKDKFNKFKEKKLQKTVGIALAGWLAVFSAAATFGAPIAIAAFAGAVVGFKRLVKRKYMSNPAKILRNRDYTALTNKDLEQQELAAMQAKHGDTHWPFEKYLYSAPMKEAKAAGPLTFAEYCTRNDSDIADLVRRSTTHFREAIRKFESATEPKINEKRKKWLLGDAIHHLEKGWRYLSPVAVYQGLVWTDNSRAKKEWQKRSPRASLLLMREFQEILDESPENWKNRDAAKAAMTNLMRPKKGNAVKPSRIRRVANKGGRGIKRAGRWLFRIGKKPIDPQIEFDRQLNVFLDIAYGSASNAPGSHHGETWRYDMATIGGQELFAEWQIRGGQLEPAAGPQNAKRVGGSFAATTETHELIEALQSRGLDVVSGQIYARLKLYHAMVDAVRQANFDTVKDEPKLATDLKMVLRDQNHLRVGLKSADEPSLVESIGHDWRNLWYTSTRKEKIFDVVFTAGEATVGAVAQLGFLGLDDVVHLPVKDDPDSLFKVMDDKKKRDATAQDAGSRATISLSLWVLQLGLKKSAEACVSARREYVAEKSGLVTGGARARAAAGITLSTNQIAPEIKEQLGDKDYKNMATYFGAGVVKQIGNNAKKITEYMTQFVEIAPGGFQDDPVYVSGLDKALRKIARKERLDLFALRIKPLSEYYATMDKLDSNLNELLMFLELSTAQAIALERRIFKELHLLKDYEMFDLNSVQPGGDPTDNEGHYQMPATSLDAGLAQRVADETTKLVPSQSGGHT